LALCIQPLKSILGRTSRFLAPFVKEYPWGLFLHRKQTARFGAKPALAVIGDTGAIKTFAAHMARIDLKKLRHCA
jgi:hypothetical protein